MTVKRIPDPLGIEPDYIEVDASEGDDAENAAAWNELLRSLSLEARIERCRRHPDLIPSVEALRQRALELGAATRTGWIDWQFRAQYEALERAANERDIAAIRPLAHTGAKVRKPLDENRADRSSQFADDAVRWQARAKELWAMPQHHDKSKSDIARLIDSSRWNTIRKKINKP
jgi:hypothetical protein